MIKTTILTTGIFFAFFQVLIAQDDEIVTSLIADQEEVNHSPKKYKYFAGELFEQKTIFKATLISNLDYGVYGMRGAQLAIERKLLPAVSVEGGWLIPRNFHHGYFFKGRYYYNKRKAASNEVKKINNFNGNYFFASVTRGINRFGDHEVFQFDWPSQNIFSLGFGQQTKVGEFGFYDLDIALNYHVREELLQLSLNIGSGLAWGWSRNVPNPQFSRYDMHKESYDNERGLLKIYNPGLHYSTERSGAGLGVQYEFCLLNNLSMITGFRAGVANYRWEDNNGRKENVRSVEVSADLELRYYYNAFKKLSNGWAVRNFTGSYVSSKLENLFDYNTYRVDGKEFRREEPLLMNFLWGYQQRVSKRGYFDFNAGIQYNTDMKSFSPVINVLAGITLF